MVIIIIGWFTVALIAICLFLWAYSEITDYNIRRLNKRYYKNLDTFADKISGHKHWLNSPERVPFRELFKFIVEGMRQGHISGEALRNKVDEIINKNK